VTVHLPVDALRVLIDQSPFGESITATEGEVA
jgi:hypothetical protein